MAKLRMSGARDAPRNLFVIGPARAGTRLIRDLTATHPDAVSVPYDVNYVWRLGNERLGHDELTPDLLTSKIRDQISTQLNRYRKGRQLLVEKTLSNSLRVPFVRAAFNDAVFVHLIRDPLDVVESAYRQWLAPPQWRYIVRKARTFPITRAFGYARSYARRTALRTLGRPGGGPPTWGPRYRGIDRDLERAGVLEVCALQALRCAQAAEAGFKTVPVDAVLVVRYERFVDQPASHLRAIWQLAALDPELADAEDICESVSTASIGRGWRELDDQQRHTVLRHVGESRIAAGYQDPPAAGHTVG